MPAPLARRSIARTDYAAMVGRISAALRFERMVRPRASWLAYECVKIPAGLICLVLETITTLPIPLGHVAPGTAICFARFGPDGT